MDIDVPERDLFHEVKSHHHHPGNPEEQDVKAGDHDGRRVKGFQGISIFGPTHGGKGPKR